MIAILKKFSQTQSTQMIATIIMFAVSAVAFSFDIYTASMPQMLQCFSCSQEEIQSSITIAILGGCISTLIIGPLSDTFGRRVLLIIFQILYTISSFVAAISNSLELLLLMRFLQGLAGSGPIVLGYAVIKDISQGPQTAIYFSYITTTITTSLIVAPIIGGYFATYFDWTASFFLLAVFGLLSTIVMILFLPETLKHRKKLSFKNSLTTYKSILANKSFMIAAFIPAIMLGGFMAFVTNAPFYFIVNLGINPYHFGLYQGLIMAFNTVMSAFSGWAIAHWGLNITIRRGLVLFWVGGLSFFLLALADAATPLLTTLTVSMYSAAIGFIFGSMISKAMDLFPKDAGSTSAVLSLVRGVSISACATLSSLWYASTQAAFSVASFMMCCVALVTILKKIEKYYSLEMSK